MKKKERKFYIIAILLSLLFHAALLLILNYKNLFASNVKPEPPKQPLTLIFQQPKAPQKKLPDQFYELEENPNANEQKPKQSNILSTKSSVAAAPNRVKPTLVPVPKTKARIIPRTEKRQEETGNKVNPEEGTYSVYAYKAPRKFSKKLLSSEKTEEGERNVDKRQVSKTELAQRDLDPELVGDFALSTYAWNWAPYWLAFKKKLLRNWFAPPAYYKLGLIYGYTILRFKVNREGRIYDMKVLRQVGHHSLQESSVSAINSTFPFRKLPDDFPDPYLEVTIKMIYPNLREYGMARQNSR